MMAVLIALFLAFGRLVLDGGRIYFEKRRLQAAADAAAYGGALELKRGVRPNVNLEDEIVTAGRDDARINGVEHGVNTIDVAINHPPTTGPNAGSTGHVEAIITETVPTFLMRVLNFNTATIRARGVAGLEANGDACVIALDPDDRRALRVAGTALLDANCGIMSNSYDPCGMEVKWQRRDSRHLDRCRRATLRRRPLRPAGPEWRAADDRPAGVVDAAGL